MSNYTVTTSDVDGRSTRRYASLAGAVKRFEEMLGLTTDQAIAEVHHKAAEAGQRLPKIGELERLSFVSMYGTRVTFVAASDEAQERARAAREAAASPVLKSSHPGAPIVNASPLNFATGGPYAERRLAGQLRQEYIGRADSHGHLDAPELLPAGSARAPSWVNGVDGSIRAVTVIATTNLRGAAWL